MTTAEAGIAAFKKKFKEKTMNKWEDRHQFIKYPNKYFLMEKDYSPYEENLETSSIQTQKEKPKIAESTLPTSVKNLIQLLFNVNEMNRVLEEMNYDGKID